jgi:hypothetical protein
MKGLLRGLVAVGLLAGAGLVAGCEVEGNTSQDAMKSPIQEKYQPPSADEAQPLGDPEKTHPNREQDQEAANLGGSHSLSRGRSEPLGGGTTAPNDALQGNEDMAMGGSGPVAQPQEGLGLGLADSYKAAPAQGGSGQQGQALPPQPQPQEAGEQAPQDTGAPQQ